MWSFRFVSIRSRHQVDSGEVQRISKATFIRMKGRHPNYGTELFQFVNTTRQALKESDDWVPDAFQIWQEEQFDMEMEKIIDEIKLDNLKRKSEHSDDALNYWSQQQKKQRFRRHTTILEPPVLRPKIPSPVGLDDELAQSVMSHLDLDDDGGDNITGSL